MKLIIAITALTLSTLAFAQDGAPSIPDMGDNPDCNWGGLTARSIVEGGHDQGGHSSDPSGDGKGAGDNDQPRAGLGNVVEKGNLQATCELIESLL